jgi:alpha-galactosidase
MKHQELALTPPMGWNSWDCYGASVSEDDVRRNARWMAQYLREHGWEYIVVDIQWYEPTADSSLYHPFVPLEMDGWSRLVPAANRFPSAAGGRGFRPLSDYVHSLGLKFGIHIMRGIPRQAVHANTPILGTAVGARSLAHPNSICPWNTDMYGLRTDLPESQLYYDSLFELYAQWGVDFVKVDDIAASRLYPTHLDEIRMLRKAIDACGRGMVLSLSPGPAPVALAGEFRALANLWRITDDFWDRWDLLADMFDRCEQWFAHETSGGWPDCDMLPLGHIGIRSVDGGGADRTTRFTRDEQRTMMSLWSIFRSPLILGGELSDNDEWTISLLTNPEILEMHREGTDVRLLFRHTTQVAWTSRHKTAGVYLAIFNIGESKTRIEVPLASLGTASPALVRDLWERKDLDPVVGKVGADLSPHGSAVYRISALTGH